MEQKIICLIAGQRSGTTAFRSFLSDAGPFADLGEPFDTSTIAQPESFYGFCRERKLQITDLMSGPAVERVCRDYLATLQAAAGGRHLLFDVKYNSWGTLRMPWTYQHQEPYFLAFLKYQRATFITIWREDVAAQMLSDRIAAAIGKWHNITAGDRPAPIRIDVDEAVQKTRLQCLSEEYFLELLKGYPKKLVLKFEDLFDGDGGFSVRTRLQIEQALRQKYAFLDGGRYRKNEIDLRQWVSNYDEAVAAINRAAKRYRERFLAAIPLVDGA